MKDPEEDFNLANFNVDEWVKASAFPLWFYIVLAILAVTAASIGFPVLLWWWTKT